MPRKILQIDASSPGGLAATNRPAATVVSRLVKHHPGADVAIRDLAGRPGLDAMTLRALGVPSHRSITDRAARVAGDDAAIAEVKAADILVIGASLRDSGEPARLDAWIDSITRAGVTFRHTAGGPRGLLEGKRAYVVFARTGSGRDNGCEDRARSLRDALGFLGIVDVTFLDAEGRAVGGTPAGEAFEGDEAGIHSLAA